MNGDRSKQAGDEPPETVIIKLRDLPERHYAKFVRHSRRLSMGISAAGLARIFICFGLDHDRRALAGEPEEAEPS